MKACMGCTKRNVTADYNCHSHCRDYLEEKMTQKLRHIKAVKLADKEHFHMEVYKNINRKYGNKQI